MDNIMTDYTQHMTQDMLDNIPTYEYLQQEYIMCHKKFVAAKDAAKTSLPATATTGKKVLHGACMHLHAIKEYWETRKKLAENMLPICIVRELENNLR